MIQMSQTTLAGQYRLGKTCIAADLAVAWEYAVDPFAPMRTIPGISWRPGQVTIRHVPRRTR